MKHLHRIGLSLVMLAVSGAAFAGHDRYDPRGWKGHHHGKHAGNCTIVKKVTQHGRYYKEEVYCKAPKQTHYMAPPIAMRPIPPQRHVYVVPMMPQRPVKVIQAPPPRSGIVINQHGVKVYGSVTIAR